MTRRLLIVKCMEDGRTQGSTRRGREAAEEKRRIETQRGRAGGRGERERGREGKRGGERKCRMKG